MQDFVHQPYYYSKEPQNPILDIKAPILPLCRVLQGFMVYILGTAEVCPKALSPSIIQILQLAGVNTSCCKDNRREQALAILVRHFTSGKYAAGFPRP